MTRDNRYIRSLQSEAAARDEDRKTRRKAIREGGDADAIHVDLDGLPIGLGQSGPPGEGPLHSDGYTRDMEPIPGVEE